MEILEIFTDASFLPNNNKFFIGFYNKTLNEHFHLNLNNLINVNGINEAEYIGILFSLFLIKNNNEYQNYKEIIIHNDNQAVVIKTNYFLEQILKNFNLENLKISIKWINRNQNNIADKNANNNEINQEILYNNNIEKFLNFYNLTKHFLANKIKTNLNTSYTDYKKYEHFLNLIERFKNIKKLNKKNLMLYLSYEQYLKQEDFIYLFYIIINNKNITLKNKIKFIKNFIIYKIKNNPNITKTFYNLIIEFLLNNNINKLKIYEILVKLNRDFFISYIELKNDNILKIIAQNKFYMNHKKYKSIIMQSNNSIRKYLLDNSNVRAYEKEEIIKSLNNKEINWCLKNSPYFIKYINGLINDNII